MLLPVFALFSRAGEYGIYDIENYKNAFPEQATEYASPDEIASGEMTTSSLLDIIKKITGDQISSILKSMPGMLLLIIIGVIAVDFAALGGDAGMKRTAAMAVNFIIFLYIMGMLVHMYTDITYKVDELYEYGKTLSSVMASFMLFSGNYTSVSVMMSSMIVLCTFLSFLSQALFPAVCAVIIVSSVSGLAGGGANLNSVARRICGLYMTVSTTVISILSLLMGFQNRVAQAADSAVLKSAKIASAYAIPVVGGVISESVDNISSGFMLIKNSFGFGAVCVILLSVLPSLISILIYKMLFALTACFCDIAGSSDTGLILTGVDSLFNVLLITIALNALTYIYCLILFTGLEAGI